MSQLQIVFSSTTSAAIQSVKYRRILQDKGARDSSRPLHSSRRFWRSRNALKGKSQATANAVQDLWVVRQETHRRRMRSELQNSPHLIYSQSCSVRNCWLGNITNLSRRISASMRVPGNATWMLSQRKTARNSHSGRASSQLHTDWSDSQLAVTPCGYCRPLLQIILSIYSGELGLGGITVQQQRREDTF